MGADRRRARRPMRPVSRSLGLDSAITRRDFVNGALAASGAAALTACGGPAAESAGTTLEPSGSAWTGYGGVGDYAWSNGNTEVVRDAAHGVRDGRYDQPGREAVDEEHDLIVVGGGFSGFTAAYEFHKAARPGERMLLLENHPMVGGEAKQNEIDVDGHRLVGPQGSNAGLIPTIDLAGSRYETYGNYYRELGLPMAYPLEPVAPEAERLGVAPEHFLPMIAEEAHQVGYHFRGHGWVLNPKAARFANTPWPAAVQREVDDFVHNRRDLVSDQADPDRWLDSMTYRQLLDRLGYGAAISRYVDPFIAVGNFGVCGDAISAYAAKRLTLPGTIPSDAPNRIDGVEVVSFPGGNAGILRAMLRQILPESIPGSRDLATTLGGPVRFDALDRNGAPVRIRLSSTALRVEHDGAPDSAGSVLVTYAQQGRLRRARAKAVVMATGSWINRRVVRDLPAERLQALAQFNYGPVMVANVALRNWRCFARTGISVARWFDGIGWHAVIRRNVALGPQSAPLGPDGPTMLTLYIPFLYPGRAAAEQGALARQQLMQTSYAEFERQIRTQLSDMFAAAGFDARRDIAGIVLNRWGHAYHAPGPGWFFGRDGAPPPHEVARRRHGRIAFGHSELQGNMNMGHAMLEGRRAALEAIGIARA